MQNTFLKTELEPKLQAQGFPFLEPVPAPVLPGVSTGFFGHSFALWFSPQKTHLLSFHL